MAKVSGSLSFLGKFDSREMGERVSGILRNEEINSNFWTKLKTQSPEGNYKMTISEVLTALSSEIIQDILRQKVSVIWENAAGNSQNFATGIKEFFENLQRENGKNPNFASIEALFVKSFESNLSGKIEVFLSNLGSHLMLKNLFNS